jgi:hypothetical protein
VLARVVEVLLAPGSGLAAVLLHLLLGERAGALAALAVVATGEAELAAAGEVEEELPLGAVAAEVGAVPVAVGAVTVDEDGGGDRSLATAHPEASHVRHVGAAPAAKRGLDALLRPPRAQVDDAGDGAIAVEGVHRAADHLDPVEVVERHEGPVGEHDVGLVHAAAVDHDQGPASVPSAIVEAAGLHRVALAVGGGVGDEDAGLAAQQLRDAAGSASLDGLPIDHRHVPGDVEHAALGSRSGDGDLLHDDHGERRPGVALGVGVALGGVLLGGGGLLGIAQSGGSQREEDEEGEEKGGAAPASLAPGCGCGDHRDSLHPSRGWGEGVSGSPGGAREHFRTTLSTKSSCRCSPRQVSWLMGVRETVSRLLPRRLPELLAQWPAAVEAPQSQWRDRGRISRPSLFARDGHLGYVG